eukprot:6192978-Pleurochrysis_carterae.AAC.1
MLIVASLHYRSGRILMYGWTMMCKWGHPVPVATLPATNMGQHGTLANDGNSANHMQGAI